MSKGTINARPKVAPEGKQSTKRHAPQDGELAADAAVQAGTERVHQAAKRTSRAAHKHVGGSGSTDAADQPGTTETKIPVREEDSTPARVRKPNSKRLSAAAAERLRTPIGKLDDEYRDSSRATIHKPKDLALTSYEFGYESGRAAGEEDMRRLHRFQYEAEQGVTPKNVRLYQAFSIFLTGTMFGMLVFGLFLSTR